MIEVLLNKPEFEYDIHSLIKAFPGTVCGCVGRKKNMMKKSIYPHAGKLREDTIQITWRGDRACK